MRVLVVGERGGLGITAAKGSEVSKGWKSGVRLFRNASNLLADGEQGTNQASDKCHARPTRDSWWQ